LPLIALHNHGRGRFGGNTYAVLIHSVHGVKVGLHDHTMLREAALLEPAYPSPHPHPRVMLAM